MWKLAIGVCLGAMLAGAAEKVTILKAARLFDGKSERVVSPGVIVVSGGRIAAVGAAASIPAGAETIDLGDATLLPGFMDAHTHLSMPFQRDYRQAELDALKKTVAERAIAATENARKTLMAGFTRVRDLGSDEYIDVGLRNAIRDGITPGPRMLVAVHALGATGGHCDPTAGFAPLRLGPEPGVGEG